MTRIEELLSHTPEPIRQELYDRAADMVEEELEWEYRKAVFELARMFKPEPPRPKQWISIPEHRWELLKQVIEACEDLPYLRSCGRCETESDMPELWDVHEAVRKYKESLV